MPQEPKKPIPIQQPVKITIGPDPLKASLGDTTMEPIESHVFELPNPTPVKQVRIEKDPKTGAVHIHIESE